MQRKVNIQTNQKVSTQDFLNFGNFPRESFDNVVSDLGGFPASRYVGFAVEQTGVSEIRVGTGRFYKSSGAVFGFDAEGGATIDLLDYLPAVAKRIATVVVYGNAIDTDLEPRTFLIDPTTGETEGREVAVENRRQAYVDKVLGQESATPEPAAIQSDYVAVAHVVLTPAGIEEITQLTANRLTSIRANAEKIAEHEARFASVGPQIDTLKTDISGLAATMRDKADGRLVRSIAGDLARVKEAVGLPDNYVAWGADRYLSDDETDKLAAGYSASVLEGVRFPNAAAATQALALENPLESRVTVNDNMALPTFNKVKRLSIVGRDGEWALTSGTVETVELIQRTETRTRRRYYSSETHCTNSAWWHDGRYDPTSGIFTRNNGETFEVDPTQREQALGHFVIRVRGYVEETYQEPYWDRIVHTENVVGSIVAQTFLNSQDGWLTGVNLFFTKKAAAGDVRVLIVETVNGAPALDKVLAKKTLTPADLAIYPSATAVAFKPTFLTKGRRYAVVLISSGAHFVATVNENKFAQGSMFYSTDGAFVVGDLWNDLAFETEFAVFSTPFVIVQLQALELAGGIGTIDINADSVIPDGTRVEFEVRIGAEWKPLGPGVENILTTKPSLAQFRARLIGTTDVMPALGLTAARSEIELTRAGNAFTHVSTARNMPANVNSVELTLRLENWDGGVHTLTPTILRGAGYATVETADLVVDTVDPVDPNAIIRVATFNLAAAANTYKIKLVGATASAAKHFHVAERVDVGY